MLVDIDKIIVGDRIRRDFGDIQELADDIKQNTLLNALVVTPSGNGDGTYLLIAGERRLRACKLLGYKAVPVNTVGVEDAMQAFLMEISENECRKEFTKTERLEYARRLALIESARAKERMLAGKADPTQNIAEGETRQIVAQALGTNHETLRQDQIIADNADLLDPADFESWDEGKLSTNKAYQKVKAAQRKAEQERDEALDELEEAYHSAELMEAEVASLRRQVAEKPQPEVVEREVVREVVPSDYQAAKMRVADLEHLERIHSDDNKELRRQLDAAQDELKKARGIIGMSKVTQDVRRDAMYLTQATISYVRQYGGLTWTVERLADIDESTRRELESAVRQLATFSTALLTNLEEING